MHAVNTIADQRAIILQRLLHEEHLQRLCISLSSVKSWVHMRILQDAHAKRRQFTSSTDPEAH